MPASTKTINLVPASEFEQSFWGKFLKWAVTAGRYIIIMTELVVIMAFFSRFKFDRDMAELSASLEGQKNVLEAQYPIEVEFREVQAKLEAADKVLGSQLRGTNILERLVGSLSPDVKLLSLAITKRDLKLQAVALSEKSLGNTLARMNGQRVWRSVELTDFSAESGMGIKFSLNIRL